MNNATFLTPMDTRTILDKHLKSPIPDNYSKKCQNLSLILARYVPKEAIDKDLQWIPGSRQDRRKWRNVWLTEEICPIFTPTPRQPKAWEKLWKAAYARWQAVTADAKRVEGHLISRLVVGLGGKGVLEFGLTLDHVTGLPIISGSALKGVCRAYGLLTIAAQSKIPLLTPEEALARLSTDENESDNKKSPVECLDSYLTTTGTSESDEKTRSEALQTLTSHGMTADRLLSIRQATGYEQIFGNTQRAGLCFFYDAVVSGLPSQKEFVPTGCHDPPLWRLLSGRKKHDPAPRRSRSQTDYVSDGERKHALQFCGGVKRTVGCGKQGTVSSRRMVNGCTRRDRSRLENRCGVWGI